MMTRYMHEETGDSWIFLFLSHQVLTDFDDFCKYKLHI